jgi:hypothetical protein
MIYFFALLPIFFILRFCFNSDKYNFAFNLFINLFLPVETLKIWRGPTRHRRRCCDSTPRISPLLHQTKKEKEEKLRIK